MGFESGNTRAGEVRSIHPHPHQHWGFEIEEGWGGGGGGGGGGGDPNHSPAALKRHAQVKAVAWKPSVFKEPAPPSSRPTKSSKQRCDICGMRNTW